MVNRVGGGGGGLGEGRGSFVSRSVSHAHFRSGSVQMGFAFVCRIRFLVGNHVQSRMIRETFFCALKFKEINGTVPIFVALTNKGKTVVFENLKCFRCYH